VADTMATWLVGVIARVDIVILQSLQAELSGG
jgi:hypothetical protein